MRVDRAGHLQRRRLQRARDRELGDQLGHVGADHVDAEDLARVRVGDDLQLAVDLAQRLGLAVGAEGELADVDLAPVLARLRLGLAERGDLRVAVGAARDRVVVDRHRLVLGDRLRRQFGLRVGGVGQRELADDVADRVDARHAGLHVLVDGDVAPLVRLDAGCLQPDVVAVRDEACGEQHAIDLDRPRLPLPRRGRPRLRPRRVFPPHLDPLAAGRRRDGDGDLAAADLRAVHLRGGEELDAAPRHRPLQLGAHLLVLERDGARQELDDRGVDAVGVVGRGELDADRPGADDQHRTRLVLDAPDLLGGDDVLAVEVHAGQRPHARAGGDDDVPALDLAVAVGAAGDGDAILRHQPAPPAHHVDLVLAHQVVDALDLGVDDLPAARDRRAVVGGDVVGGDAEVLGVVEEGQHLGAAEDRLARDAAPVEADAPQLLALHHRRTEAELGGADGGDVAARPAADHHNVVVRGSRVTHRSPFLCLPRERHGPRRGRPRCCKPSRAPGGCQGMAARRGKRAPGAKTTRRRATTLSAGSAALFVVVTDRDGRGERIRTSDLSVPNAAR